MTILLTDFTSELGLKYYLRGRSDIADLNINSCNLHDFFGILLKEEQLYLGYTINIEGKTISHSGMEFLSHINTTITIVDKRLFIHLSGIKVIKKFNNGFGSEIISNLIKSIREFNKNNLEYKFAQIEGYINPDQFNIDLEGLVSFYEKNEFQICNLGNGNLDCYINFLD